PMEQARAEFEPAWQLLTELGDEIESIRSHGQERARELEMLRAGLDECERIAPQPGEDEQLRAEEDRLANAEALIRAAGAAHDAISQGARDALASALAALQDAAGNDAELDGLAERTRRSVIVLDELSFEFRQ